MDSTSKSSSDHDQPIKDVKTISRDEEDILKIMQLPGGIILPMVLKTAIEIDLFGIIANSGRLSADELAASLPMRHHNTAAMLDRIMAFLASYSFLMCTNSDEGGGMKRLYGLAPISTNFVQTYEGSSDHTDNDAVSLATLQLLLADKVYIDPWYHLKDAILEGGLLPFNRAHGVHPFEYHGMDARFSKIFNNAMNNLSKIIVKKLLEVYNGFEGVKEVVDVGGGLGATLGLIVSKYSHIRGVNFDLPHVIQNAPQIKGVEHVGGDMFENVPKGQVIFMKWILHDWNDEYCLKLLKNCWEALPECGKVVVVDAILPECPSNDPISNINFSSDIGMMTLISGGKERTKQELEDLAKSAGFSQLKLICPVYTTWVIELSKNGHL